MAADSQDLLRVASATRSPQCARPDAAPIHGLNPRQLEAFRTVLRTGSVTSAARLLHLSQPAVTRLIADLERSFGFALFRRTKGRTPVATAEALALSIDVDRSLQALQSLRQAATDIRNGERGCLRVACLPALAAGFLAAVLRSFHSDNPAVRIDLTTRDSAGIRASNASQMFDVALADAGSSVPGFVTECILRSRGVCVLPAQHPLASRAVVRPEDLFDEPFVSQPVEDHVRVQLDNVFEMSGVRRRIVAETACAIAACGLVSQGIGCAVLDQANVMSFASQAVAVRPFAADIGFEHALYVAANRSHSEFVRKFIRCVKHAAANATKAPAAIGSPQLRIAR